MRILHVITGLSDGGAEAVLYRTCLQDRTNEHIVVSLKDEGKYGPLLSELNVPIYCLGISSMFGALHGLIKLARIMRSEAPDAIQTWMYHADLLGGLTARVANSAPVFWGVHNTRLEPGESRRTTILIARLNAWLSRSLPTRIIYCAQKAREVHEELGYDARRSNVIPNGYDLDVFRPDTSARETLRRQWRVDDHTFVIGLVARLDPQKDHRNLLTAVQILRQEGIALRCVLVGTGMESQNVAFRAQLEECGLRADDAIILLGQRNDVPNIMNALDLHVLSSSAEAFPNVLCEAMACGTPCVTTDVGDASIIVSETGWTVPPKHPSLLANAIKSAHSEWAEYPERWNERSVRARDRIADRYTIDAMLSSYHRLWSTDWSAC